jgi:hypothetical protein
MQRLAHSAPRSLQRAPRSQTMLAPPSETSLADAGSADLGLWTAPGPWTPSLGAKTGGAGLAIKADAIVR